MNRLQLTVETPLGRRGATNGGDAANGRSLTAARRRFPAGAIRLAVAPAVATLVVGAHGPATAWAADIVKANNTTGIATNTAWVGNVNPTAIDTAVFNDTFAQTAAIGTGGPVSYLGFKVTGTFGTAVNINNTSLGNYVRTGTGGIDLSTGTRSLVINSIDITADQTWSLGANTLTAGNGRLTGAAKVTVTGTGELVLGSANTLTNGLTFLGGRATATDVASLGGAGKTVTFGSTAEAFLTAGGSYDNNFVIAGTGWAEAGGPLGAIRLQNGASVGGTVTLTGDARVTAYNSAGTIVGAIGETGGARALEFGVAGDTGVITLSAANTYTGGTRVNGGQLILTGGDDRLAAAGALALGSGGSGGLLQLGDGNGPVNQTVAGLSTAGTGGAANAVVGGAGSTSTLTVNSTAAQVFAGALGGAASNANNLALTKAGAGTLTLSGPRTYTGPTLVNGGQLRFTTGFAGASPVTVADGAAVGVNVLAAGQTWSTPSLSLGAAAGATFNVDVGGFGNLTAPAWTTTTFTTGGTNTINVAGGGLGVGTFPLLKYGGSIGGAGYAGLTLGTLPSRVIAVLVNDAANGQVSLNVTGTDQPKWTGTAGTAWDINNGSNPAVGTGTVNWKEANSGNPTRYLQTGTAIDSVRFDDTAAATATVAGGATTVNLTTTLTPTLVTVDNSSLNYVFAGTGKLSGTTPLTKRGTGTLTLANTGGNDTTGQIAVVTGTLQVGDGVTAGGGQLGNGPVQNDAALVFNRPDALTVANPIGGAGTLTKLGAGVLTLSGGNTFSGPVAVNAGTLKLGGGSALGGGGGATTVQSGATLDLNGFAASPGETIRIAGVGVGGAGAVVNTGTGGSTVTATNVTLTANATLGGTGQFDVRGPGASLVGGGFDLTKVGTNEIDLASLGETHLKNVVVNGGRLVLEGDTTPGDAGGAVSVAAGAQLGLANTGNAITKPIILTDGTLGSTAGVNNWVSGPVTVSTAVAGGGTLLTADGTALRLSGNISGAGGLTKAGPGIATLEGTNTYLGTTTVTGGVLRAGGAALAASNLSLNGGVLEAAANFSRPLGTAAGQVQLPGGTSGFSAAGGGPVAVDLSGAGAGGAFTLTWGAGGFAPAALVLNETTATNLITLANALDLKSTTARTVNVNAQTATLSGRVSNTGGNGGLTKGGAGTLVLSGANTYAGTTTVNGGTLQLANPAALGTSALSVGAAGVVDLNGNSVTVSSLSGALGGIISDQSQTSGVTTLTVNIASGSATFTAGIQDGPSRQLAFVKTGAGTIISNNSNSDNAYTGGTTVSGGRLELRTNNNNLLPYRSPLAFAGSGTFAAANNSAVIHNLSLGSLSLLAGDATIEVNNYAGGAGSQSLTFETAPVRSPGATLNVTLANTTAGTAATPDLFSVQFYSNPWTAGASVDGGIYYSGYGAAEFATYASAGYLRPLSYAGTPDANTLNVVLSADQATLGAGAGQDVQLGGTAGSVTAQPTASLRTLKIAGANNLTLTSGATLTLTGGGLLKAGGNAATIAGGAGLSTGAAEFVIRANTAADAITIATPVTAGGLTKAGAGTLSLTGNNAGLGGDVYVNAGKLLVNNAAGSGTGTGTVFVRTGATLGGSGSIGGGVRVSAGATVAPGNSPGVLSIAGPLTFDGGTFAVEVNGPAAGTGYDQLAVGSGVVSLGAGVTALTLTSTGYTPGGSDRIWIVNHAGSAATTGFFTLGGAALPEGGAVTIAGTRFNIFYGADLATNSLTGGNDVVLAVPEPATVGLGALLGVGLLARRRRARG